MNGQIDFEGYVQSKKKIFPSCDECVCTSCLLYWSERCLYGKCIDDKRALNNPYDAAHPKASTRMSWTKWSEPGEQAHWCRGGVLYPATYCRDFVKYQGCKVKECIKANVQVYQDGYIQCSLIDNWGCEKCYEEFEAQN